MSETLVNFIAFEPERDACLMVLVEEGPWEGSTDDHLRALQDRLYGCLNAALDGALADQFPASKGKTIVIQIDCYDLPREPIDAFVNRFAAGIAATPDYSTVGSKFVREWQFEVNHDTLPTLQ
jgi:hypothetical protein